MNKFKQFCIFLLIAIFTMPTEINATVLQEKMYEVLLHSTSGHRKRQRMFGLDSKLIVCMYVDGSLKFSFPSSVGYLDIYIKDAYGNLVQRNRIITQDMMVQIPNSSDSIFYTIEVLLPSGEVLYGTFS